MRARVLRDLKGVVERHCKQNDVFWYFSPLSINYIHLEFQMERNNPIKYLTAENEDIENLKSDVLECLFIWTSDKCEALRQIQSLCLSHVHI